MDEKSQDRHLSIRLESLADMVFGLALSIGALLLAISGIGNPQQIESSIITFGFSFLILIFVWARYTSIVADLPQGARQTRKVTYLTFLMLFLVVIEPYLFNILNTSISSSVLGFTSSAYAIDICLITLIIGLLISVLVKYEAKSNRRYVPPKRYLNIRASSFAISAIMAVSAIPIFWQIYVFGIQARFFMWLVILPFMMLGRFMKSTKSEPTKRKR